MRLAKMVCANQSAACRIAGSWAATASTSRRACTKYSWAGELMRKSRSAVSCGIEELRGHVGCRELRPIGRAGSAGMMAELGFDYADPAAARAPFKPVQFGAQRREQVVAGISDAASEDNDFRVQHIDKAGQSGGEGTHRIAPIPGGFGRPAMGCGHQ